LEESITVLVFQLAQPAPLADGPAMYFGAAIMTFALPSGAFVAAAIALFYLFRARHSGPRLRWSAGSAAQVASVTTREPGPTPAPEVIAVSAVASAAPDRLEEDVLAEQALLAQSAPDAPVPPLHRLPVLFAAVAVRALLPIGHW
jgi:hypothetical protein